MASTMPRCRELPDRDDGSWNRRLGLGLARQGLDRGHHVGGDQLAARGSVSWSAAVSSPAVGSTSVGRSLCRRRPRSRPCPRSSLPRRSRSFRITPRVENGIPSSRQPASGTAGWRRREFRTTRSWETPSSSRLGPRNHVVVGSIPTPGSREGPARFLILSRGATLTSRRPGPAADRPRRRRCERITPVRDRSATGPASAGRCRCAPRRRRRRRSPAVRARAARRLRGGPATPPGQARFGPARSRPRCG